MRAGAVSEFRKSVRIYRAGEFGLFLMSVRTISLRLSFMFGAEIFEKQKQRRRKMKKAILILVLAFTANFTMAQIVITSNYFDSQLRVGVNTVEYVDTTDRMIDIGSASVNNYWDFSDDGFIPSVTYREVVHDIFDSPYASHYPDASRAVAVSVTDNSGTNMVWAHFNIRNDAVINYGYGLTVDSRLGSSTIVSKYLPGEEEAIFPMTYGTYWTFSYTQQDDIYSPLGNFSEEVMQVDVTCWVDGAGTLILPNGDEVEALRIHEVRHYTFAEWEEENEATEIVYTFLTGDGREVSVSVFDGQANEGTVQADAVLWCNQGVVVDVEDTENDENPSEFGLKQNYPNPFNPTTTIEYSIAKDSDVKVKVYDILGNEVATLVNGFKPAGNYTETFNARNLPSGTYFVRLQAGNKSDVKKITLLK